MDQPCLPARRHPGRRARTRWRGWRGAAIAALLAAGCRASTPQPDLSRVSPDVVDTLRAGREAHVVVALALPAGADAPGVDPALLRAEIARVQADVLARLSPDDYRSRQLFAAVPAMSGTVRTRAGLTALLTHPSVRRVDLDPGGTGSGARR